MNSAELNPEREGKAIEALIAAALHQEKTPVDPSLIAKYMSEDFTLTAEERQALEKLGSDPLVHITEEITEPPEISVYEEPALAALYRNKPKGGFSPQTEEELERKRRELREKLRERKNDQKP